MEENNNNEKSGKPVQSLTSIAGSVAGVLRKLDDPATWAVCPGCGLQYPARLFVNRKLCPECESWERASENREREQEREQAEQNECERLMVISACGGERAYRLFTSEAFKVSSGNRRAFEAVEQFDSVLQNLFLWGPCGTGKSHLAAIIGRNYAGDVLFTELAPLLRSLRGLMPAEEQAAIDRFVQVPVLILDDLGIEKDTEFAISTISEIISHRLKADQNGLVVTSNLSLDALATKLKDDRLTSRLAGMCQVIEIKGQDYRLQGQA